MLALHNTSPSITAAQTKRERETKCDSLIEEMEKGRTNITFSRLVVRANPCRTTKFGRQTQQQNLSFHPLRDSVRDTQSGEGCFEDFLGYHQKKTFCALISSSSFVKSIWQHQMPSFCYCDLRLNGSLELSQQRKGNSSHHFPNK